MYLVDFVNGWPQIVELTESLVGWKDGAVIVVGLGVAKCDLTL